MNKTSMQNQKSEAEKRNGRVFGVEQYTDARIPDWATKQQISPVTGPGAETGGAPTDARVPGTITG